MEKHYVFKSLFEVLGFKCKAIEWRRAERWGLCWNACATRRTFSGVRTVWGRPGGLLLTMDAVVLNCVTQFSIVWHVGTFPFLPISKCRRKTCCITVAESLFLKNVSTANARCSFNQCSTQWCVFHSTTYKDVGMALNLNRLIVSAPPYTYFVCVLFFLFYAHNCSWNSFIFSANRLVL